MGYILLTELESTGLSTCKIKGLSSSEIEVLENGLKHLDVITSRQETFFEADIDAVRILNMLDNRYTIRGQSMVIEKSNIGGRTVQTQKIAWTLLKPNI